MAKSPQRLQLGCAQIASQPLGRTNNAYQNVGAYKHGWMTRGTLQAVPAAVGEARKRRRSSAEPKLQGEEAAGTVPPGSLAPSDARGAHSAEDDGVPEAGPPAGPQADQLRKPFASQGRPPRPPKPAGAGAAAQPGAGTSRPDPSPGAAAAGPSLPGASRARKRSRASSGGGADDQGVPLPPAAAAAVAVAADAKRPRLRPPGAGKAGRGGEAEVDHNSAAGGQASGERIGLSGGAAGTTGAAAAAASASAGDANGADGPGRSSSAARPEVMTPLYRLFAGHRSCVVANGLIARPDRAIDADYSEEGPLSARQGRSSYSAWLFLPDARHAALIGAAFSTPLAAAAALDLALLALLGGSQVQAACPGRLNHPLTAYTAAQQQPRRGQALLTYLAELASSGGGSRAAPAEGASGSSTNCGACLACCFSLGGGGGGAGQASCLRQFTPALQRLIEHHPIQQEAKEGLLRRMATKKQKHSVSVARRALQAAMSREHLTDLTLQLGGSSDADGAEEAIVLPYLQPGAKLPPHVVPGALPAATARRQQLLAFADNARAAAAVGQQHLPLAWAFSAADDGALAGALDPLEAGPAAQELCSWCHSAAHRQQRCPLWHTYVLAPPSSQAKDAVPAPSAAEAAAAAAALEGGSAVADAAEAAAAAAALASAATPPGKRPRSRPPILPDPSPSPWLGPGASQQAELQLMATFPTQASQAQAPETRAAAPAAAAPAAGAALVAAAAGQQPSVAADAGDGQGMHRKAPLDVETLAARTQKQLQRAAQNALHSRRNSVKHAACAQLDQALGADLRELMVAAGGAIQCSAAAAHQADGRVLRQRDDHSLALRLALGVLAQELSATALAGTPAPRGIAATAARQAADAAAAVVHGSSAAVAALGAQQAAGEQQLLELVIPILAVPRPRWTGREGSINAEEAAVANAGAAEAAAAAAGSSAQPPGQAEAIASAPSSGADQRSLGSSAVTAAQFAVHLWQRQKPCILCSCAACVLSRYEAPQQHMSIRAFMEHLGPGFNSHSNTSWHTLLRVAEAPAAAIGGASTAAAESAKGVGACGGMLLRDKLAQLGVLVQLGRGAAADDRGGS